MPGKPVADRRVNIYIDGYNFYVPLSTAEEKHYELCWCDFLALANAIVNRLAREHPRDFGSCRLGSVKYFTATIPSNMPKDSGGIERKYLWLDALAPLRIPAMPITNSNLMAISIPIDADHHRSEATLGCTDHRR